MLTSQNARQDEDKSRSFDRSEKSEPQLDMLQKNPLVCVFLFACAGQRYAKKVDKANVLEDAFFCTW